MILGVNGYKLETSDSSHDAAACIIDENGKIIAGAEEERFTRKKRAVDAFPHNAIAYCLHESRRGIEDVTDLAVGWDYRKKRGVGISDREAVGKYLPTEKFQNEISPDVHFIPHHRAHAASSFFLSGFDEANVLVLDGRGEEEATTLFIGSGNKLESVKSFPIKDSLGFLIEELGNHFGMGLYAAGKVMGLSAYGSSRIMLPQVRVTDDGYYSFDIPDDKTPYYFWSRIFNGLIGAAWQKQQQFSEEGRKFESTRRTLETFDRRELDVAYSVQAIIQDVILRIAETLHRETGIRNFCLSGGVALNCPSNSLLAQADFADDVFIFPAANDAGCSVGAAADVLVRKYGVKPEKLKSSCLGPQFSNDEIRRVLEGLKLKFVECSDSGELIQQCADDIAKGKIVGWFQGRMEMGPRALGHRSILANPLVPDVVDIVNEIKGREHWRPLAISILSDAINDYFINYKTSSIDSYMLTVAQAKAGTAVSNVAHTDGSTRPQIVDKEFSPVYYELIKRFFVATGAPFLLNTSFNRFDEPIVCTPLDAVRTFYTMGLDSLYLGDFILRK